MKVSSDDLTTVFCSVPGRGLHSGPAGGPARVAGYLHRGIPVPRPGSDGVAVGARPRQVRGTRRGRRVSAGGLAGNSVPSPLFVPLRQRVESTVRIESRSRFSDAAKDWRPFRKQGKCASARDQGFSTTRIANGLGVWKRTSGRSKF